MKDPGNYKSCLQQIFYMLKFNNEDKKKLYDYIKKHRDELDRMDTVEMSAAFALLGEQKRLRRLMSRQKKGDELSMGNAIEELILDGEKRGQKRGERIGERRGQERLAHLIVVLSENHRDDLIRKAASDSAFRKKLFKEYNI